MPNIDPNKIKFNFPKSLALPENLPEGPLDLVFPPVSESLFTTDQTNNIILQNQKTANLIKDILQNIAVSFFDKHKKKIMTVMFILIAFILFVIFALIQLLKKRNK